MEMASEKTSFAKMCKSMEALKTEMMGMKETLLGGENSKTLLHYMKIISEDMPHLREELEQSQTKAVELDWDLKIAIDNIDYAFKLSKQYQDEAQELKEQLAVEQLKAAAAESSEKDMAMQIAELKECLTLEKNRADFIHQNERVFFQQISGLKSEMTQRVAMERDYYEEKIRKMQATIETLQAEISNAAAKIKSIIIVDSEVPPAVVTPKTSKSVFFDFDLGKVTILLDFDDCPAISKVFFKTIISKSKSRNGAAPPLQLGAQYHDGTKELVFTRGKYHFERNNDNKKDKDEASEWGLCVDMADRLRNPL